MSNMPSMTTFDTGALFLQSVPFARTLGVSFDSVESGTAVARLADRPDLHNHVGGPHAGVVFSLAESASGAAMLSLFGDTLDRATPLATVGRVAYRKLALGDLTAEAVVQAERAAVLAELSEGRAAGVRGRGDGTQFRGRHRRRGHRRVDAAAQPLSRRRECPRGWSAAGAGT